MKDIVILDTANYNGRQLWILIYFMWFILFLWTWSRNIWIELWSCFFCIVVFGIVLCNFLHCTKARAYDLACCLFGFLNSWSYFVSILDCFFIVYSFFNFILRDFHLGLTGEDRQWMWTRCWEKRGYGLRGSTWAQMEVGNRGWWVSWWHRLLCLFTCMNGIS